MMTIPTWTQSTDLIRSMHRLLAQGWKESVELWSVKAQLNLTPTDGEDLIPKYGLIRHCIVYIAQKQPESIRNEMIK